MMKMRAPIWLGISTMLVALAAACGGNNTSDEEAGTGGGGTASGGGNTGGSAAGGSSTGGGTTGGAATGGAATGGSGGGVDVELGTCDTFSPCGGDLEGTWSYTAGCIDPAELGFDSAMLDTLCPTATYETAITVDGTITFAAGTVLREGGWDAVTTLNVPAACATLAGGCAVIQTAVTTAAPEATTTCTDNAGTCDCTVTMAEAGWAAGEYTVAGDVLTLSDGRTFDYCVSGTGLEYQETGAAAEPGTFQLTLE